MIRAGAALAPLCALLLGASAGSAELPVAGITIGSSIGGVARALGVPVSVASDDSGHRFAFNGGVTAYADDDGFVLAVDARTGNPRIDVDGTVRAFPIGSYSTARADAELADVAEFALPGLRSYRLAPRRDLVLGFDGPSNRLVRVTYGEPGQLARLGLLPGDDATRAVAYRAPVLRTSAAAAPGPGGGAAVYRVAIDRGGIVRGVDVVVGSGSPAGDAVRVRLLAAERYAPATLDGRPIAATVFVELPR
jgi:hypothetical protein